ncbi:hypothetical protein BASA81_003547 [Batrachochytrium salamandrivorans]|nr:hypothetical protein BASA81_003547 [Batrachochytrium salamandrivorans]
MLAFLAALLVLGSAPLVHAADTQVVQLNLYEDAKCTNLTAIKPYALTGTCQATSAFLTADDLFLPYNLFTCSGYTRYFFPDCTKDGPPTTATFSPTVPADAGPGFEIPKPQQVGNTCTKSQTSAYYYQFSCVTAQVVAAVSTSTGSCADAADNTRKVESYYKPCSTGVSTVTADVKSSSTRFTQFGNVVMQELWTSRTGCPTDLPPQVSNYTLDVCVDVANNGGSLLYKLYGNGAASLASSSVALLVSFVLMALLY